jgi:hypothetical protein
MPRQSEKDRVRSWHRKITAANKAYDAWEKKFRCEMLEEYWEGFQWADNNEIDLADEKYVINLVFPSVEIKIPSLLYYRPQFRIKPRPSRSDDAMSIIEDRAKLQQDTLNTFVSDKRMSFREETTFCLRESFYRFAVVEVGYSGDFIDNPLLQKPELTEEEQELAQIPRIPNPKNPRPESVYIKRIPAKQFRVSCDAKNILSRNDWVGYWEEHYISDIKNNPRYKNTSALKATGKIASKYESGAGEELDERDAEGNAIQKDTIRIWKIWDLRSMTRLVFPDAGEKFLLEEPFSYLPFATYKPYERLKEWYPLPPVFNWLHPQNELNDTREMQRVHRKRFYRRYTYTEGAIDEPELRKLEDGGDGVYAKANKPDPIQPVPDAPLDPSVARNIPNSRADFMEISGVSDEQRGVAGKDTTATQANIVDVRSRIRESYQRMQVSEWLSEIGYLILRTIRDRMALSFWVQMNVDPAGPNVLQEAVKVAAVWKQITATQLGDIQEDIEVDVQSLTPMAEEQERVQWNQVLGLLANPALLPVLIGSDVILRKTLGYYNIRSEKDIQEFKRAGTQMMAMMAAAAAAKAGAAGVGGAQPAEPGPVPGAAGVGGAQPAEPGPVPGNAAIADQIGAQI